MFKFVFFFLFSFASYAQKTKETTNNTPLTSPLVVNYSLTEDFLLKLEKIAKECKNLPPERETAKTENDLTTNDNNIEGYITYISSKAKFVSLLKENDLTPKDFVIGHLALQATLNALINKENFLRKQNIISSKNIEFTKEHMYRVIKILRTVC
ncbi:hypothetical protein [Bartonella pachyuromydis]|uniref:Uncharacterized protein n=1 Tax=Bartonella pachyuromydis TaxID=931097 RepID=A0ABP8VBG1_9HYPH